MKLNTEQQRVVANMIKAGQAFADQMMQIMKVNGIDSVDGCYLMVGIEPKSQIASRIVIFGEKRSDCGFCATVKGEGKYYGDWTLCGKNSIEYVRILDPDSARTAEGSRETGTKELPPDGLWLCDYSYHSPLDCGV